MAYRKSFQSAPAIAPREAITQSPTFLDHDEVAQLTGFQHKRRQIEQLRRMAVPFFISRAGRPVVSRAAIDGTQVKEVSRTWQPAAIMGQDRG